MPVSGLTLMTKKTIFESELTKKFKMKLSEKKHFHPETEVIGVGKVKFFDYLKNKFGFIAQVKVGNDVFYDNVHVSLNGLGSSALLSAGDKVSLTVKKGRNGYFATDVRPISQIDLPTILKNPSIFEATEIDRAIRNGIPEGFEKEQLGVVIDHLTAKIGPLDAWSMIGRHKLDDYYDEFINKHIDDLPDKEKLSFFGKNPAYALLEKIAKHWVTREQDSILLLVALLRKYKTSDLEIPPSLRECIASLDWSLDDIYKVYSLFIDGEIAKIVLKSFSFLHWNSKEILKDITQTIETNEAFIEFLKHRFKKEQTSVKCDQLIDIYEQYAKYRLIESENTLMELVIAAQESDYDLNKLLKHITESSDQRLLSSLLMNYLKEKPAEDFIDLLEMHSEQSFILQKLTIAYEMHIGSDDCLSLLEFLSENIGEDLVNNVLDIFSSKFAKQFPLMTFKLAINNSHLMALKLSYAHMTFKNPAEVIEFTEIIKSRELSEEIKTTNKGLTGFTEFINGKHDYEITRDLSTFLVANSGYIQSHVLKFLVFQFHVGVISREKLLVEVRKVEWTEISSLFIVAIVEHAKQADQVLLDKLSELFKKHFEVLRNNNYSREKFLNSFKIHQLLKPCNGRKTYNAKFWKKNNTVRWYYQNEVTTGIDYPLDCFCEGRPWKTDVFWNADTNTPTKEQYKFYFCKGSYCASRNDLVTMETPYYEWTVVEICRVMNIKVEQLVLAILAGWANRMNKIIERLFCRACNNILRPLPYRPRTLGYHAVPVFCCVDPECSEFNSPIRFTHCLNSKCSSHLLNEPLDSRDCKSCRPQEVNHVGLLCPKCGQSCPRCSGNSLIEATDQVWLT